MGLPSITWVGQDTVQTKPRSDSKVCALNLPASTLKGTLAVFELRIAGRMDLNVPLLAGPREEDRNSPVASPRLKPRPGES